MSLLSRNLQVLKHKDRSLFDRLKKVERAPYVSFISSKSGHVVARVLGKDKRVYLLHSSYDPLSEAEDVASKVNWFGVSHVVVMGIGCGYQLLPILRRVPKNVRVYAVEPDIALFKAVFETIDWTEILSFQNLHLVVGLPPLNAADAIMRTLNPSELKAIEFLKHPVYYRLLHGYFSELERRISESIRISLVNLITALQFSFRDQKNTLLNLKWLFRGSPVKNIFRSFVKKPAVVVCAGPSLDKNIYYLREVKDKALLIAVDTALRPLLYRGIHPHVVVAGDPQDANFDHFRLIDPKETQNIFLVADLRVSPLIFDFWRGKIFICDFGSEIVRWVTRLAGEMGRISVWGSVSTVAISLAYELGCDPIALIGQDLAYTGARKYASYTWIDETGINSVDAEGDGLLVEKNIWGRDTHTAKNMLSYRDWLSQFFRKNRGNYINSTEGGILKDDVMVANFVEVAYNFLREPLGILSILENRWMPFRKKDKFKSVILRELGMLEKRIREIKSFCEEKLSIFEKLYDKIGKDLQEAEEKLKSMWRDYPFLNEVFLPVIFSFNRNIEKARLASEEEYLRREREAYFLLFAGIVEIASNYEKVIGSSMRLLRGEEP
ncbi:MAG: hypothetical protein PWQ16_666 [bacterium]|nr:hypothetical protein [bacterium]